ncbi:hypothetical protein ACH5RR_038317 [Cinchona calisaya]|uniref:RING-type E3 ubiquitin transferase n=1 Tax=Cinchona calisaya TaxID=153742 RepID=A0ABD2XYD6_9GENT
MGLNLPIFLSYLIFFFISTPNPTSSVKLCNPVSCNGDVMGPIITFPFRLKNNQDIRCGYPGFDLSCNNQSQTILSLPNSGDFVVNWIDYSTQSIFISDPNSCLPTRIFDFSVIDSTFKPAPDKNYTLYNCTINWSVNETMNYHVVPVVCDGDYNSTILATPSRYSSQKIPPSCHLIPNVSIPLHVAYVEDWTGAVIGVEDLELVWNEPSGCKSCQQQRLYCGFKSDSGNETDCARPPSRGLPRSAKYGIIIGVGIPGLVCLIGIACYTCGKVRDFSLRRNLNTELSTAVMNQPPSVTVAGLDAPTIESYPKTILGESRRLPKPNDNTCPICLSEYQSKETLRSIPECNHYFHASCLDEWLKLNGTCPLCRNSPESMSVSPCSSMSSTFSASSSA